MNPFMPATAKDAVERWDRGETITSIQMGGVGPGHEQAIQIAIIEICRDQVKAKFDENAFGGLADATLDRINEDLLGLTAAQAAQAKNLSFFYLKNGWEATLKKNQDRLIMILKAWPKAPSPS